MKKKCEILKKLNTFDKIWLCKPIDGYLQTL